MVRIRDDDDAVVFVLGGSIEAEVDAQDDVAGMDPVDGMPHGAETGDWGDGEVSRVPLDGAAVVPMVAARQDAGKASSSTSVAGMDLVVGVALGESVVE